MKKELTRWLTHEFSTGSETGDDYKQFEREMRSDLKKKAAGVGFTLSEFNKNHYCFSAVLCDDDSGSYVYVSIPDVRFYRNEWFGHVLYRTIKHRTDWSGGVNHYTAWENLPSAVKTLVQREVA